MAKKNRNANIQNTGSIETKSFTKGMVKDLSESFMPEGSYLHARNAVNYGSLGNMGVLSNEPSNAYCVSAPYTIIGFIHLYKDVWSVYSTNDIDSEIGIFNETSCLYTTVVNDRCLGFKRTNLIIGESKENFDCTYQVYWADALNPDRYMNMTNPPWIQTCSPDPANPSCIICTDTTALDCEKLRLARLTKTPCIRLEQGPNGGELLNGSYQAVIAYSQNEQRISDYSMPTNVVSMFDHRNVNGSLDVIIEDIDDTYDEFELVIIGFVNQQMVARRMGIYSTRQTRISIDRIDPAANIAVPLSFIPLDRPAYERSEGIYRNGDYLLRVAPTTKFSFNYQPLANNIEAQWVSVRYPANYYKQKGYNLSYLRDEVYPFFVRWIYNTGDKTESYHIPGRVPTLPQDTNTVPSPAYGTGFYFEEFNTATSIPASGTTSDGGVIVAKGQMGYWESSERYPDKKPDVWGNLCGKNIRHHKMPSNELEPHFDSGGSTIRVLGVEFSNIAPPVDNQGVLIPGIIGYEILRGSREGNKTVIAKGIVNNMGSYYNPYTNKTEYYQNYPYNDLRSDPYLSTSFGPSGSPLGGSGYSSNKFTFHSPDTQFKHPFLSSKELKIYNTVNGLTEGYFKEPDLHPKHKLITDLAFILSAMIGFGIALKSIRGTRKTTLSTASVNDYPRATDIIGIPFGGSTTTGVGAGYTLDQVFNATAIGAVVAYNASLGVATGVELSGANDAVVISTGATGDSTPSNTTALTSSLVAGNVPGTTVNTQIEYDSGGTTGLPLVLRLASGLPTFFAFWAEGTDTFLRLIKAFSMYHQYAVVYESHCFYDNLVTPPGSNRTAIVDGSYMSDQLQGFANTTVNNLYRSSCLALDTNGLSGVSTPDDSRVIMSDVFGNAEEVNLREPVIRRSEVHYTGLKTRLRNQYGQIDGIKQIPTGSCIQDLTPDPLQPGRFKSDIIFGGDTYIGRYSEKNTMFFFSDWMYDLPNDFEYDYRLRKMLPYPTYWMDTRDYQLSDSLNGLFSSLLGAGGSTSALPSGMHNLDGPVASGTVGGITQLITAALSPTLIVKDRVMYLFNSGVRDFFVESEVNVSQRDWDDMPERRHYDAELNKSYEELFRTKIIKSGNFFKYDYSLSSSRFYQGYPNWGSVQHKNYDPIVAETCYSNYPKRVIYSQPQNLELRYDNWLINLINNYKDFGSKVTSIESIGKNGAIMLFESDSPLIFAGVDELQTTQGTKITIGDGGLFSQTKQSLVNTDPSYEYGSCQSKRSIINTPAGLYWISQNQGRVFSYGSGLENISNQNLRSWFDDFLPYKLLDYFPDFELTDNPVIGIGCQSVYDSTLDVAYFCKKDYSLREEWKNRGIRYIGENNFQLGAAQFKLGDQRYFDDASWTISYDSGSKAWISFHDWHPDLSVASKHNFLTSKNSGVWRHNYRTDSFCNFYNQNYPFEVELIIPTGQNVNTLKSIEYLMETYVWGTNGIDRNHVLDFNFDRAFVYNTEQNSGELRLNITPKNNAPLTLTYPRLNPTSTDILYSKEEQKFRFNQFNDITADRGEFTTARRMMWNTDTNGYTKTLNPVYVNYNKSLLERKKFRHYQANLRLIRRISAQYNIHLKIVNAKNQYSSR